METIKSKVMPKQDKIESAGYLAFNGDTMEYEDIRNLVIRFGVEKFKLTITQASESMDFLSRLFLKHRNKNEVIIKKDHCVTSLPNFKPKENRYPSMSYRCNCSFMFEYDYEGIIENAQCSISLRGLDKNKYVAYLSTNSSDYTNNVDGHLLMFSNPKLYTLFDSIKPLLEFDIYSDNEKIGWGYFQSGLIKVVSGIKL